MKKLQVRLAQRLSVQIKLDGKFGAQTFRAIIDFQQRNFGRNADDGIVGPETAEKSGFSLPLFDFDRADVGHSRSQPLHGNRIDRCRLDGWDVIDRNYGSDKAVTTTEQTLVQGTLLSREYVRAVLPPAGPGGKRAIYDAYIDFFTSTACQEMLKRFHISEFKKRLSAFFRPGSTGDRRFHLCEGVALLHDGGRGPRRMEGR